MATLSIMTVNGQSAEIIPEALLALKGGLRGQALAKDDASFEISKPVDDAPRTGSGAAFRKADSAFHEAYNKELAAFKKTPEFAAILTKWGFDPTVVEGVTAEELCKTAG